MVVVNNNASKLLRFTKSLKGTHIKDKKLYNSDY